MASLDDVISCSSFLSSLEMRDPNVHAPHDLETASEGAWPAKLFGNSFAWARLDAQLDAQVEPASEQR